MESRRQNTLQSGVTKHSEYFLALVENRARQIGVAAFSLFTGVISIAQVKSTLGWSPCVLSPDFLVQRQLHVRHDNELPLAIEPPTDHRAKNALLLFSHKSDSW